MTLRRAEALLTALRLGAILATWGLALAWCSDAQAACAGRAHEARDGRGATLHRLSPELLGDGEESGPAGVAPLKTPTCTGAFCSRIPSDAPGMDFGNGLYLRVELWASVCDDVISPDAGRLALFHSATALRPIIRRDVPFHPPR